MRRRWNEGEFIESVCEKIERGQRLRKGQEDVREKGKAKEKFEYEGFRKR